jgi:hypothetical protein
MKKKKRPTSAKKPADSAIAVPPIGAAPEPEATPAVEPLKSPTKKEAKAAKSAASIHRHPNVAEIYLPGEVVASSKVVARDAGDYDGLLEIVALGLKARGLSVGWRFFDANGVEGENPNG